MYIFLYNFSNRKFTGLSRSAQQFELNCLNDITVNQNQNLDDEIKSKIIKIESKKYELLNNIQDSEPHFIFAVSEWTQFDPVYIGNSLPIREWDLFSSAKYGTAISNRDFFANRGANGIDGQISTYLGWSRQYNQSWCVVGDLTALYDLASLGLAVKNNGHRIVIINNSGGQIFNRLFKSQQFLNAQNVNFEHWAKMWNWNYIQINSISDFECLKTLSKENTIIELRPDNQKSSEFWSVWDHICFESNK